MVGKVTPNSVLSASRLPAVMGLSKYRSPNDELQVSVDAINGKVPEDFTNEAMQWGNQLESIILQTAAERLGLTDLVDVHPEPYFHPKLPLCCSLDGTASGNGLEIVTDREAGIFVMGEDSIILTGKGVIEAKLTSFAPEDSPPVWRGPIQLQAQMDIIGATWGVIATLYQGTTLRCSTVGLWRGNTKVCLRHTNPSAARMRIAPGRAPIPTLSPLSLTTTPRLRPR
jgi:hypothetical protein